MRNPQVEGLLANFALHSSNLAAQARRRISKDELNWVLQALLDEQAPVDCVEDIVKALMKRPISPLAAARLALGPCTCSTLSCRRRDFPRDRCECVGGSAIGQRLLPILFTRA